MTTVTTTVHFRVTSRGRKVLTPGPAPTPHPTGRVPRVARLMALAIRFEGLLESGAVANQAELAALGHVTRARLTQIMNLLHLAPDIQEQILQLPAVERGRDRVSERDLRPIAGEISWVMQRAMWQSLLCTESDRTPNPNQRIVHRDEGFSVGS